MEDLAAPVDVPVGHPEGDVGPCILRCLRSKGFCVLSSHFSDELVEEVLRDIQALAKDHLRRPPKLVADGLLGEVGSAKFVELPALEATVAPAAFEVGEALRAADLHVSELGRDLVEAGAQDVRGRGRAAVHETGPLGLLDTELTEDQAAYWFHSFSRSRILVLQFFGPGPGTLELRIYGEVDSEPYQISTRQGLMVILRSDILACEHRSTDSTFAVSAFLVDDPHLRPRGAEVGLAPAAKALDEWLVSRMQDLKHAPEGEHDVSLAPSIPREVQRAMNRMILRGERVALRGAACKVGAAHHPDQLHGALVQGIDFPIEVPISRWPHESFYESQPGPATSVGAKFCCRHMTYNDGMELFDNKLFQISSNEASKMDVAERQLLELGYMAAFDGGVRKKNLVGSDCGVFVAWQCAYQVLEDRSMGANRINFCLGCRGPSLSCDVDHASSLVAVKVCCSELGRACAQGLAVACQLNVLPEKWRSDHFHGLLSRVGRAMTFDSAADGFCRSDGVVGFYLKKLAEQVDGAEVSEPDQPLLGIIQAAVCRSQGRSASLRSPDGPCLQELLAESARVARISPLDVDYVECCGKAVRAHDAIEAQSAVRATRPQELALERQTQGIALGAIKSNIGSAGYCAGMVALLRTLLMGVHGSMSPLQHLFQVNPLIAGHDLGERMLLLTENLASLTEASFLGVTSCGMGGTNAHLLTYCRAVTDVPSISPLAAGDKLAFWPGGGGFLAKHETPRRAYTIVGSWSSWEIAADMEEESEGVYGYSVTLGENCWESFQIWLDGDPILALHPGCAKASKATSAHGPEIAGTELSWLIDGRRPWNPEKEGWCDESLAVDDRGTRASETEQEEEDDEEDRLAGRDAADRGWPGAEYRVRLRVAGRWRSVDWERLSEPPSDAGLSALMAADEATIGRYFITGSFNAWSFSEMMPVLGPLGVFEIELELYGWGEEFQVVRNKDWQQTIYSVDGEVYGPDDGGQGLNWHISGRPGDVVRVEFRRARRVGSGDVLSVSWHCVRKCEISELDPARWSLARQPRFFLIGSWDAYRRRRELLRTPGDANELSAEVEVPSGEEESTFQILLNGSWSAVLHPPSSMEAHASWEESAVAGPSRDALAAEVWTIRRSEVEGGSEAALPALVEIRLRLRQGDGWPEAVSWSLLGSARPGA
mmetsp:Transcript_165015/g.529747  ORF Transcript_165015/g.529747 Transcript_165015/m.529747 type:complete len:1169 (+) Transcript_165015:86-3592(+)